VTDGWRPGAPAVGVTYHTKRRPNCIVRPSSAVAIMPTVAFEMLPSGVPKFAWFRRLNISHRNSTRAFRRVAAGRRDAGRFSFQRSPLRLLQDAFATDVRPVIREWRVSKGLPADPLQAFRESDYIQRITAERSQRTAHTTSSYA
jgi:hypothetical protein